MWPLPHTQCNTCNSASVTFVTVEVLQVLQWRWPQWRCVMSAGVRSPHSFAPFSRLPSSPFGNKNEKKDFSFCIMRT